jgi:hypothetical protein
MPQNIVPALDQNLSYIYCPSCMKEGEKVRLTRDQHLHRCPFGHGPFDNKQLGAIRARGGLVEMEKYKVIEQPPDYAEKFSVWCNPEVWKVLQEKYEGRFIATMVTMLEALADDSIVFIDGVDAKRLREMGVKNGVEMRALVEKQKELEGTLDAQKALLDRLKPILNAAGLDTLF